MIPDDTRPHTDKARGVTRRAALRAVATGAGVAAGALWVGRLEALAQDPAMHTHIAAAAMTQAPPFTPKALSKEQLETVATLCELIIPTTETPGARAALVDRFIDNVLANSRPADKERFVTGLTWMDTRSAALNGGKAFTAATPEQQTALLTRLAAESGHAADDAPGVPFFNAVKGMTIAGYYSTQIGLEQELGDSGQLFNPTFVGCTHPEHQI
jgi:gluconate 2-dehydrogenase gamma chain